MLPLAQKIAFLLFAAACIGYAAMGFRRMALRIRRGRSDSESRTGQMGRRLARALAGTFTQRRIFKRRPLVNLFHSFIFYGFIVYLAVNAVDGAEGYLPFSIRSDNFAGAAYNLCADVLSVLVILGVVALVLRRFVLPSRRDFRFNAKTLIDPSVRQGSMTRDSILVSSFIVFHVASRMIAAAAKLKIVGHARGQIGGPAAAGDAFQPFATMLASVLPRAHAFALYQAGYWGALGSVLVFLGYFPWSKHVHIFTAPIKSFFRRPGGSGELPRMEMDLESDSQTLGAEKLEDLAWPRLLDAYACIQCNRCQDVCPASATGKELSPAALEINKRMELNRLGSGRTAASPFERGAASPNTLLEIALTREALWACTTCGACMEVCPVETEQMLDIVDIRRHQVMMKSEFPAQLQTAFRGMERASNPWGLNRDSRLAWAQGLAVPTIEERPEADVLYWTGCAAAYDPQAQKTARAFVQLLLHAEVNFAVLGNKEGCTGDPARRAGNEYLYLQLAEANALLLNRVKPKLMVTACPHCMNTLRNEYPQLGATYQVMHHTEYLDKLVAEGRLTPGSVPDKVTYHDPCYLGRHNGVYDAPRNLLQIVAAGYSEMDRRRESSFCCGAGGGQFWKEEEAGAERVADNRLREARKVLGAGEGKVLAVGCPFCKNMLNSAQSQTGESKIEVKDIAELLLEAVEAKTGSPG